MLSDNDLTLHLDGLVSSVSATHETISYVRSILSDGLRNKPGFDLSANSLSIMHMESILEGNFHNHQRLGDWVMFSHSIFVGETKDSIRQLELQLAANSYRICFNMMREWKIFEELSDKLPQIVQSIYSRR